MTNLVSDMKKQRHYFADKCLYRQSYGFSSSHVWMWELNHKESCTWRIDDFELWTFKSPLDSKEIKPVNHKGNQPWIFIGRTDTEAEAPIFWSPDAKSQLIGKDPDAGKDWGEEVKRATKDKMVDGITEAGNKG